MGFILHKYLLTTYYYTPSIKIFFDASFVMLETYNGCFYCMIFFPPAIIIYIFKQNKNKKTIKMTTLRDFFCLVRVSKNSSFYSIKATLLVLQNNNYTHPIFAMLNEKKVKKNRWKQKNLLLLLLLLLLLQNNTRLYYHTL